MANPKPQVQRKDWRSYVDKADPNRKKPKVSYIFSNGRKFFGRSKTIYGS